MCTHIRFEWSSLPSSPCPYSVIGNGWTPIWLKQTLACLTSKRLYNAWKFFWESKSELCVWSVWVVTAWEFKFLGLLLTRILQNWDEFSTSLSKAHCRRSLLALFSTERCGFYDVFCFQRNNIFMVWNHYLVRKSLMFVPVNGKCIWLRKLNFLFSYFSFSTKL